jgi:type IV pilus assembly protein PilE
MNRTKGFSFIEVIIVIAIISILAAIIYPTYTTHLLKVHRADGQTALLDLAARMERYYAQNNSYVGATLARLGVKENSPEGFYLLDIPASKLKTNAYVLRAIPRGEQVNDRNCGTLAIDQSGTKSITGTGKLNRCW